MVEHDQGPLLIVAGPGTGKTRTLTHRIAYLVKTRKVPAKSILAVTFTHKAAREMQARLEKLLDPTQPLPLAVTFHSFCLMILSTDPALSPRAIIDDAEQEHLIHEAAQTVVAQGTPVAIPTQRLKNRIMGLKQQIIGPYDSLVDVVKEEDLAAIAMTYRQYQQLLELHECWDYEDLIFKSVKQLESDERTRNGYQNMYPYIFIDEYQDLNQGQYRLIKALSPKGRELCAIGDPNQAIYGFRGAEVFYFNRFKTDFPDARLVHLARNYRSTQTILEASNQVIKTDYPNQTKVKTYSQIDGMRTIHIMQSPTGKAEAVAIGKSIERLVGGTGFHAIDFGKVDGNPMTDTLSFKDFAVLYRTRAQGETIAPIFDKAGIPFQIANRRARYQDNVLGGLLSLLKMVQETGTYLDFKYVINKIGEGIGSKTWQSFKSWGFENEYDLKKALHHARRLPITGMQRAQQSKLHVFIGFLERLKTETSALTGAAKVRYLVENTKLRQHLKEDGAMDDDLRHLLDAADRFGHRTDAMFAHLALESDTDLYDSKTEKVALMTLHAAKGLEFPVVFIAGCENEYLPYYRSDRASVNVEEERRLFYVGMTRAQDQLYLSWAQTRQMYGKKSIRVLSPFVQDIEARLKTQAETGTKRTRPGGQTQLALFNQNK